MTAWVVRVSHVVLIALAAGLWKMASRIGWMDAKRPALSHIIGVLLTLLRDRSLVERPCSRRAADHFVP